MHTEAPTITDSRPISSRKAYRAFEKKIAVTEAAEKIVAKMAFLKAAARVEAACDARNISAPVGSAMHDFAIEKINHDLAGFSSIISK